MFIDKDLQPSSRDVLVNLAAKYYSKQIQAIMASRLALSSK
jgi:hypothetical protein